MTESELQQIIQMDAVAYHSWLLRNNSGALPDKNGRIVRYGLGNISAPQNAKWKSSDLIGITTIKIDERYLGSQLGIFTAVEVKEPGWQFKAGGREEAQRAFIEWVKARGGIGGFAQSLEDFRGLLGL